jgi:hypothetical protein
MPFACPSGACVPDRSVGATYIDSPTVIVHEFGDDQSPINSLILRPDGTFYGTTADIYTVPDIRTIYSLKPE